MPASKKKSIPQKILKITGIVSATLLGIFLIISILLLTVLEPYAERLIKKKLSQQTEGLYDLGFTDLDINLLSTTVRLQNIDLTFDSAIHSERKAREEASSILFNLTLEELEFSGVDILAYLANSKANITSILIDQPAVEIMHDTEVEQTKSKKQQDISEIISSIGIGHFNLKDAQISYFKYDNPKEAVHKIPMLNFRMTDFNVDFLDRKDFRKMINLDNFFISLQNQSFVIANDAYTLKFDLFEYDMSERELTIEEFSAIGEHEKLKGPMIAPEIQVPLLKMRDLDLVEALKSKKLHFEELLIEETFVKLLELPDLDVTVEDVYRGLSMYFESTKIDELNILRSAVSMNSRKNKEVLIQKIDYIDLMIEDVSFDSLSVFDSRNNLALQHLTINVTDYLLQPEKSPYTFKVGKFDMNTKNDEIKIESLTLTPDLIKNKSLGYRTEKASPNLLNINVPKIHFDGIDMIRAFENASLDVKNIEIKNSTSSLRKAFEAKSPGSGFSPESIYESFSFYVKAININEFNVTNANLSVYPSTFGDYETHAVSESTLRLEGIHFDSIMAYQGIPKAPLKEIEIAMRDYKYKDSSGTKSFKLGPLKYSTMQESLTVKNIEYKSFSKQDDENPDSISISGISLSISDLDFVNAFNKGNLQIDEILVKNPDVFVSREAKNQTSSTESNFKVQKVTGKIFDWINPIIVKSIKVQNGEARYAQRVSGATNFQTLEDFSVEIQKLNLSPEKIKKAESIIPVENIVIKANNYKFQSPDSIYTLQLDSLYYGSKRKFLTAQYFQLKPDYELHDYRVQHGKENVHRNLFHISTDNFKIHDFDLIEAYNNDKYAFGQVILNSPELAILQDKNVEKDQPKNKNTEKKPDKNRDKTTNKNPDLLEKSLQNQINEYVDIFSIEAFRIEDANFLFEIHKKDSVRDSQELDHMSLLIENIKLGDLQANDLTDVLLVDEIDLLLEDYSFVLPDSLYELRVNRLSASLAEQYIHIDSVKFEPLFLIDEYADKLDYARDRFDISVGDIDLENINFAEFFNNQKYLVGSILIDGLNGSIYRDSRVQQNPGRKPRTVQQMVKDIPIPLKVDSLEIKKALLKYSEVSKDGSEPGITTLADTNLQAINITNDSLAYSLNDRMTVKATSSFLGESDLTIDFVFSMDHPEDLYTYEGYLEKMRFQALNPLLTNLVFVKMESGVIEKIDFSVTATKHRSTGVLQFPYENLRFKILNKDDPDNPGFFLKAANWSLNNLLIKTNNPGKLFNNYRRGTIEVERNYSKSVFNHMGNSLLSGFISSTIPEPTKTILYFFSDLP